MRLKHITIKGFKAYKDETRVTLHPGANVFVGLNGSGKSTLLEAVTLVVSEVYGRRVIDLKSLLHRGARNSSLSAYVELCFDNDDRKLAMFNKDEVSMRRTFTAVSSSAAKKDEFTIDGKKVTKHEFASLLEAGGFSKANPYYVVRQGKIMEISLMTDEGRLKLLKDFSGVQIYEEKRAQAELTWNQAAEKAKDADGIVIKLHSRLRDLEDQQAELLKYQELVRTSDVYKAILNDAEINGLGNQLNELRLAISKTETDLAVATSKTHEAAERMEVEKQRVADSYVIKERARKKAEETAEAWTKVQAEVADLKMEIDKQKQSRKTKDRLIKGIDHRIRLAETDLAEKQVLLAEGRVAIEARKAKIYSTERQEALLIAERQQLSEKQDRTDKGWKLTERNEHLSEEIRKTEAYVKKLTAERFELEESARMLGERSTGTAGFEKSIRAIEEEEQILRETAEQLKSALRDCGRRLQELDDRLSRLRSGRQCDPSKKSDAARSLQGVLRHGPWRGNLAAMRWEESERRGGRLDEVGLLENVMRNGETWRSMTRVPPKLPKIAATQAMGHQVDNLIITNDETATPIYEAIKVNGGSATLTPLNQVLRREQARPEQNPPPRLPPGARSDISCDEVDWKSPLNWEEIEAVPLISVCKYPEFLAPVLKSITRRWLIVRDLDVANRICQSYDFDCVTVQGEKGGHLVAENPFSLADHFYDIVTEQDKLSLELDTLTKEQTILRENKLAISKQLAMCIDEIESRAAEKAKQTRTFRAQSKLTEASESKRHQLLQDIALLDSRIQNSERKITDLRRVLSSRELEGFSETDALAYQRCEDTTKELDGLRRQLETDERQWLLCQHEIEALTLELARLNQQKGELMGTEISVSEIPSQEHTQSLESKAAQLEEESRRCSKMYAAESKCWTDAQNACDEAKDEWDKETSELQMFKTRLQHLQKKKDALELKIAELRGSQAIVLTSAGKSRVDVEALRSKPLGELRRLLHDADLRVNEAPRVNQRALDDLLTFQEELRKTEARKSDLRASLQSVQDLMSALDERRSKTLRNSFDQVNANLQMVFGEIVPGGKAKLVIKKLSNERIEELQRQKASAQTSASSTPLNPSSEADSQSNAWALELSDLKVPNQLLHWDEIASGIEIKASFRGASSSTEAIEYFPIIALSGGQKTVLALSLIFAMQLCDKAPFYVFDEADAALDEIYRASMARL